MAPMIELRHFALVGVLALALAGTAGAQLRFPGAPGQPGASPGIEPRVPGASSAPAPAWTIVAKAALNSR